MTTARIAQESFRVNFKFEQSFVDMVEAGHYDKVHPSFTKERFPLDAGGEHGEEIFFLDFGSAPTASEVIEQMEILGFRPANATHLLAFGAQISYPVECVITFLGSFTMLIDPFYERRFPCLIIDNKLRGIGLNCEHYFTHKDKFAAVRK